jgi:two-component system, cell cycle response regulator
LIEEYRFSFNGKDIPVTVSFGVASAEVRYKRESMQDFISCADAKLYEAKETGRNRVVG